MKYITLSFLVIILFQCCSDPLPVYHNPIPNYWGHVDGFLNGKDWHPSPFIPIYDYRDSSLSVCMETRYENGELNETLSISNVPKRSGHYEINSGDLNSSIFLGAFFGVTSGGGDVLGDAFLYDEYLNKSFIDIFSWDDKSETIEGTFNITLLRSSSSIKLPQYNDTLKLNCYFITKYIN